MIQDSLSSLNRNLLNFFLSSSAAATTAPSSSCSSSSSPVRTTPNQNPLARKIKISIQNSAQNPESNPTKAPKPSKKSVTNFINSKHPCYETKRKHQNQNPQNNNNPKLLPSSRNTKP
jgi:hypothetical protein